MQRRAAAATCEGIGVASATAERECPLTHTEPLAYSPVRVPQGRMNSPQEIRIGLGVKHSTKTTSPTTPRTARARPTGRSSSSVGGWRRRPRTKSSDRPHEPQRPQHDEPEGDDGDDAGRGERALAQQRVGHVAAVELSDRHQVERGHEQAEPGGQAERARGSAPCPRGSSPRIQYAAHWKRSGSPRPTPPASAGGGDDPRFADPEEQHGQGHDEPGERARDPDVEERLAVREGALDPDERAEGADEAQRHHMSQDRSAPRERE